jgi:hypothetical protein
MDGMTNGVITDRDRLGRFRRGNNARLVGAEAKAVRLAALYSELAADYGGEDQLTATGRLMLEQACRLKLRAEGVKDPNAVVRLSNAAARLLLKIERKPERLPSLRDLGL